MRKLMILAIVMQLSVIATAQVGKDWKLGVALWTFHTVDFPESLKLVDSTGLKYIEPNTFHSAGPEFGDSAIRELSSASLKKIKKLVDRHKLTAGSIYLSGSHSIESWKREFEIARHFNVKYVTAEPPVDMWDSIDSLAGVYGVKVAIHEHWKGTSAYWHPDSVLAAIKGHKNFGACADLGHWPKSGIDPVEALKKLKGHIIGIHLKDIAAYNDPALLDVPLGTGVIDMTGVFEELRKQKFKGHIYIERDAQEKPNNLASVKQAIKYYNEHTKK